jgi:hypothetical protein
MALDILGGAVLCNFYVSSSYQLSIILGARSKPVDAFVCKPNLNSEYFFNMYVYLSVYQRLSRATRLLIETLV